MRRLLTIKGECHKTHADEVNELKDKTLEELKSKAQGRKKMTPAEKIASVHIVEGQDNYLPELNEKELVRIGKKENKKVLLKSESISYNLFRHDDVDINTIEQIIGEALYSPDDIIPGKAKDYEGYSFIKVMRLSKKDGKPVYGAVLLDVDDRHDNFEIVHVHWVRERNLPSLYPRKDK